MLKHVLRNSLISTVTVLGVNIGFLICGLVIIENVFALPGLGSLLVLGRQPRLPGDPGADPALRRRSSSRSTCSTDLVLRRARPAGAAVSAQARRPDRATRGRSPRALPRGCASAPPRSGAGRRLTLWLGLGDRRRDRLRLLRGAAARLREPQRAEPGRHRSSPPRWSTRSGPTRSAATSSPASSTAAGSTSTFALRDDDRPVRPRRCWSAPRRLPRRLARRRRHAHRRHRRRLPVHGPRSSPSSRSPGPGLTGVYIGVFAVGWALYARLTRGEMLVEREQRVHPRRARRSATRRRRILFRHALPNLLRPSLVFSMADIVLNILLLAGLSYLGLGVQPPTPEWGAMVAEGQDVLLTAWWISTLPGLVIVLVGVGFSLIGDGIADRLGSDFNLDRGRIERVPATDAAAGDGELLEVRDLTIGFPTGDGPLLAADRVDFTVAAGRDARAGRRVGLRQERHAARRCSGSCRYPGEVLGGEIGSQGEDLRGAREPSCGGVRGTRDRDDLPGPDRLPQPGLHDRRPDRRDAAASAPGSAAARRGRARSSCSTASASRAASGASRLSARAQRRHAAAGDDRDRDRRPTRSCCSPTSRRPRSTSPSRTRSWRCCWSSSARPGWRSCSSPTTSA